MRRVITALTVLLGGQLALAGGLWLSGGEERAATGGPLVQLDPAAVTAITIEDATGATLRLSRSDGGWTLPAADGYPVREGKAAQLLDAVAGLQAGLPVSQSPSSFQRFGVGSEQPEKRLTFSREDGGDITLLLGNSAGAGRAYVRLADAEAVHEVAFRPWRANTTIGEWYAQAPLQVDPASVQKLITPAVTLKRTDDGWQLVNAGSQNASVSAGEAARLVQDLARPAFESVSRASEPDSEPTAQYRFVTREGRQIAFRYYSDGQSDVATLVRSDQPWAYTVKREQIERLANATAQSVLAGAETTSSASASGESQQSDPAGGGAQARSRQDS